MGCSGSGGNESMTPEEDVRQTATLVGSAARSQTGAFGRQAVDISGTVTLVTSGTSETLEFSISDAFSTLTDVDGPNSWGELTDGEVTLVLGRTNNPFEMNIAEDNEYVFIFQLEDDAITSLSNSVGVFGFGTQLADVPTQGFARYLGNASIVMENVNDGSNSVVLPDAQSTVVARSAESVVDVEINHSGISAISGDLMAPPIDALVVQGMLIDGNGFSGGELTMFLDGEVVDTVGPGAIESANGHFFGFDDDNQIPDEVGGVIISADGTSSVVVMFVAD